MKSRISRLWIKFWCAIFALAASVSSLAVWISDMPKAAPYLLIGVALISAVEANSSWVALKHERGWAGSSPAERMDAQLARLGKVFESITAFKDDVERELDAQKAALMSLAEESSEYRDFLDANKEEAARIERILTRQSAKAERRSRIREWCFFVAGIAAGYVVNLLTLSGHANMSGGDSAGFEPFDLAEVGVQPDKAIEYSGGFGSLGDDVRYGLRILAATEIEQRDVVVGQHRRDPACAAETGRDHRLASARSS